MLFRSYFVIRVQGAWWQERTQGQTIITATMVREYLNGVMLSQRHEEVTGFLNQLVRSDDIVRGRVIRPDGTVVFSTATQEIHRVSLHVPAELFQDDRILQGTRTENAERYAMAIAPVRNLQNCQQCHDARAPFLGAIVIEKSLEIGRAHV